MSRIRRLLPNMGRCKLLSLAFFVLGIFDFKQLYYNKINAHSQSGIRRGEDNGDAISAVSGKKFRLGSRTNRMQLTDVHPWLTCVGARICF
jgi:hypothetical protein